MPGQVIDAATGLPLDSIAHLIQIALTPVFLLSGVGTLLNVFNTRLARVTDHTEHASELLDAATEEHEVVLLRAHLRRLEQRRSALDTSVILMACGGASTCGAALALFVGAVRDSTAASALVILFGAALLFTAGALTAFVIDSVLAWHGLHTEGPLPRPRNTVPS